MTGDEDTAVTAVDDVPLLEPCNSSLSQLLLPAAAAATAATTPVEVYQQWYDYEDAIDYFGSSCAENNDFDWFP